MRGQELIISSRMAGWAPAWVVVNDYPCKTDWEKFGDVPTVCTHGDNLRHIDFRFLVGLSVNATSPDESRAKELFTRIKAAGARLVAAGHIQDDKHATEQSGWMEIWRAA